MTAQNPVFPSKRKRLDSMSEKETLETRRPSISGIARRIFGYWKIGDSSSNVNTIENEEHEEEENNKKDSMNSLSPSQIQSTLSNVDTTNYSTIGHSRPVKRVRRLSPSYHTSTRSLRNSDTPCAIQGSSNSTTISSSEGLIINQPLTKEMAAKYMSMIQENLSSDVEIEWRVFDGSGFPGLLKEFKASKGLSNRVIPTLQKAQNLPIRPKRKPYAPKYPLPIPMKEIGIQTEIIKESKKEIIQLPPKIIEKQIIVKVPINQPVPVPIISEPQLNNSFSFEDIIPRKFILPERKVDFEMEGDWPHGKKFIIPKARMEN